LNPKPLLMLVPLSSLDSIDNFIKEYEHLESVQFTLIRPNQEVDGQAVWRALRQLGRSVNAQQTRVEHRNKEGLDKGRTATQIHDAAAAGNQVVQLYGRDRDGNVLKGNNEQFRLRVPVADLPSDDDARAKKLFELFNQLVDKGIVRVDMPAPATDDVLR
jgi:hypothetical protein